MPTGRQRGSSCQRATDVALAAASAPAATCHGRTSAPRFLSRWTRSACRASSKSGWCGCSRHATPEPQLPLTAISGLLGALAVHRRGVPVRGDIATHPAWFLPAGPRALRRRPPPPPPPPRHRAPWTGAPRARSPPWATRAGCVLTPSRGGGRGWACLLHMLPRALPCSSPAVRLRHGQAVLQPWCPLGARHCHAPAPMGIPAPRSLSLPSLPQCCLSLIHI